MRMLQQQAPRCRGAVGFGRRAALQIVCAESKGVPCGRPTPRHRFEPGHCVKSCFIQNAVRWLADRTIPLDTYRNIGIMAHIDAGKVRRCKRTCPDPA